MDVGVARLEEFLGTLNAQKPLTRYISTAEPKPDHAWYKLPKAEIDRMLKDLTQYVNSLLKGPPQEDKELQHLLRTCSELAHVSRSPPIKVALLGAQGAGKSLMINAIFDCEGLSLTGANGSACTSSITRYVAYPESESGDNNTLCAEIKFLSAEKRELLLKDHARSYYQWHHADDDEDDDDDDDDEDIAHAKACRQDDERLKDTAEDIFITLFGSQDEFNESWSTSAYKNGEFLRICMLKSEEALKKENIDSQGIARKIGDNRTDLLKQLRPFLTKVKGTACLWPLVDIISIRLRHEVVQAGLELIDLPGWDDINLSRNRHAEEIKEKVDVQIIFADTIRLASDNTVISSARAVIAYHGAANVKIVIIKIDVLSDHELSQCEGEEYDNIKQFLQQVEDQEAELDDDDDSNEEDPHAKKRGQLNKYKSYLERTRKQRFISTRASTISNALATSLQGRSAQSNPQVVHASAAKYMDWIRKPRFTYSNQPDLPVDMTGVPAIRKFLFSLPAHQNMEDYSRHVNFVLPAFVEKIKRTVSETNRDGGFGTIADEFDRLGKAFLARMLDQVKSSFQAVSNRSILKLTKDSTPKAQVSALLVKEWLVHPAGAFNRILKNRGTIPKGASKAKSLINGTNWNMDLAIRLSSSFHLWYNTYSENMKPMGPALHIALKQLHDKTDVMIGDCAANLVTVDKAKRKWAPFNRKLQVKLMGLMDEITKTQQRTLEWATMKYDCNNNAISEVTDDIFDEVFDATPALNPPNPKRKRQAKYVEPRIKFQKKKLENMFLQPENHFVDRVIERMQSQFDKHIQNTLDKHFAGIEKLFEDFSALIRGQTSFNFIATEDGKKMRAEIEQNIPTLEKKVEELQRMFPVAVKMEDETVLEPVDDDEISTGEENLDVIYARVAKRKATEAGGRPSNQTKRNKSELF